MMVSKALQLVSIALPTLIACSSTSPSKISSFSVPDGPTPPTDFYGLPFPNDLRRTADGRPDLSAYPRLNDLVSRYTAAITSDLDGFGLNGAIVVRFEGPIDTSSLPSTPEASLAVDASVYLVNIDRLSSAKGQRTPLNLRFQQKQGSTVGPHWLSALPYPGFPLDEGTTYALVVTNRVRASGQLEPVEAARDFQTIADSAVPTNAALSAAQQTYSPLWQYLDEPGGDERRDVVNSAVFTTQRATSFVALLRKKVWSMPPPVAADIALVTTFPDYVAYDGTFLSPNFQVGTPPYTDDGGQMEIGGDGLPVVQRMENLRVSFTVPAQEMPVTGWPVTIFATGAGGNFHSYNDVGVAPLLAARGIAAISLDQVLSGPRSPQSPSGDLAFYNFTNPQAARYNALQGAADNFSLLRLIETFTHQVSVGTGSQSSIRFDPSKVFFFGHSQGGVTGSPFVAFEPSVKAAVFTGTGALIYEVLLHKTDPINVANLVGLYIPDDPLDEFNPVLTLIQTWIERSDPANYAGLLVRHPPVDASGLSIPPRDIYQGEGFVDRAVSNRSIQAFATAVGGDQVAGTDGHVDEIVHGLTLRGRTVLTPPVAGNLDGTTAVLLQYSQPSGADGHIIPLFAPAAQFHWSAFLDSKARTGTAILSSP